MRMGEYRFCFNNEMSTFAEKMVDFEIAVRGLPTCTPSFTNQSLILAVRTGRERNRSPAALQAGLPPRANLRPRGIRAQALGPALHHLAQPEVLPHAREPQFQHGQVDGAAHLQFQPHGGRPHGHHGGAAGLHRTLLFPGREER